MATPKWVCYRLSEVYRVSEEFKAAKAKMRRAKNDASSPPTRKFLQLEEKVDVRRGCRKRFCLTLNNKKMVKMKCARTINKNRSQFWQKHIESSFWNKKSVLFKCHTFWQIRLFEFPEALKPLWFASPSFNTEKVLNKQPVALKKQRVTYP